MPRLDDPCMHRTDRDLVQALAFRRQEAIRLVVMQPLARVGQAFGLESVKIAHRALQADGGRMQLSDRRIAAAVARDAEPVYFVLVEERHVRVAGLAPERDERGLARL